MQEEVGVRGAKVAAFGLEPDIGIALDITIAADIPGVEERNWCVRLGQGVAIKIMDSYSISDPRLVEFFRLLAEENSICYQMEILPRGWTDAGGMQLARSGIPVCTISISLSLRTFCRGVRPSRRRRTEHRAGAVFLRALAPLHGVVQLGIRRCA